MSDGTVAVQDRRYDALLGRFATQVQQGQIDTLRRNHKIGELFAEFANGISSKKYGERNAEKLASDLSDRGVLTVQNPTRYLYFCKKLCDRYPDFAVLEQLGEKGFTLAHAKLLDGLAEEHRPTIETQMLREGRMISTRELDEVIKSHTREAVITNAQASTQTLTDTEEAPAESTAPVATEGEETAAVDDPTTSTEPAADDAAAPSDAEIPATVPRTGAPARERSIKSPLKVMEQLDRSLLKTASLVPDAAIVVREAAKIGFDSDNAHKRHREKLQQVCATIRAVKEPLEALLAAINSEEAAAEIPTQTDV